MFKLTIVISALVAVALAAPVDETTPVAEILLVDETTPVAEILLVDETTRVDATTQIPILWERMQGPNADGSYWWSYEAGNGIRAEEKGTPKEIGTGDDVQKVMVVEGKYSYTDKDGTLIETIYIADENGFRVMGAHLPTPPPMPSGISHALEGIADQPKTTSAPPSEE